MQTEPISGPFEYAGPLAEAVQLGLVACRVGQRLEWDAANLQAKNCPQAVRFIRPERRKGWEFVGPAFRAGPVWRARREWPLGFRPAGGTA